MPFLANTFQRKADMPEVNDAPVTDTEVETLLDMETVGDLSFDDMEEAPGFIQPPNGEYELTVTKAEIQKYMKKDDAGKASIPAKRFRHIYSIARVISLEDAAEQEPPVGALFSEQFGIPDGAKYWKPKAKAILGDKMGPGLTVDNVVKELNSGTYNFIAKVTNKKGEPAKEGPNKGKSFTNTNVRVVGRVGEVPGMEGSGKDGLAVE